MNKETKTDIICLAQGYLGVAFFTTKMNKIGKILRRMKMNKLLLVLLVGIFLLSFTSATITTTLNSPTDSSTQLTNLVTFNATGSTSSGFLANISLFTNSTGTWSLNQTNNVSLSRLSIGYNPTTTGTLTAGSTSQARGQTFTATEDGILNKVQLKLSFGTGTPSGNVNFYLYATSGDTPTGGILSSGSIPASSITSEALYNISMTSYTMSSGTKYALYLVPSGTYQINLHIEGVQGYAGGTSIYTDALPGGWATFAGDAYFDIFINKSVFYETFSNSYSSGDSVIWNVQACASDGTCGFATSNYTFLIDSSAPSISITSPSTLENYGKLNGNLTLNFTATDTNLDKCWFNYNGTNSSLISCSSGVASLNNFTLSNSKTLTVYANDTTGSLASQLVTWDYKVFENSRTYSSSAYSTSTETFILNASLTSATSITGKLIYNGTEYTSSVVDGGIAIFTNSISIPSVSTQTNVSFYWSITLDGTTVINTTTTNQTINPISFGKCGGVYTVPFINFTIKSAENPFPIINGTFKSAWRLSATNGGSQSTFNWEDVTETNSSFAFCSQFNETLYADADIEYDASGYVLNFYYLDGAILSNSTQNISIYLLNDTKATVTTLKVVNDAQQPLEDVTIQIQFYDVGTGTFYTIGMGKTDFKGEDIAYLNWYDTLYKFILIKGGKVVKTTNTTKISSTPITLQVLDDETFLYKKFQDFIYSLYFNSATNNFVLTFTKPSGLVDQGCLRVIKRTASNDTEICFTCESSSSATLYCNLNSAGNGTFIAHFYATGSWYDLDWIVEKIGQSFSEDIYDLLGSEDASFYAFMFAGIITFMMFIHPIFGIVGVILGIIGANVLGFAPLDYGIFMGIVLIGGVIIWIIKR